MLKYIITKDKKYNGLLYKGRKIIADEKYLERLVKVKDAIPYSSWRSLEEQGKLVEQGKSKTLYSNHRRGMAVDIINWKEVEKEMNKVGLINDIPWDRNHFAYDGESKATKYPIYDKLPANLEEYSQKYDLKTPKKPVVVPDVVEDIKTPQNAISEPTIDTTPKDKQEYIENLPSQTVEDLGNLIIKNITMEKIKGFFKSKAFETAMWQAVNVLIAGVITYISGLNTAYAVALIPVLNFATKYVNTTYLK